MSDATSGNDRRDAGREGGSILDDGGINVDERAGRSLGIDPYKEPDDETKREIEAERERRLHPDNRPEGAEVDNTERTFDHERGKFTDSEDYDRSEPPRYSDPEDPNTPDNADRRHADS
jgi:hypothetical protein